jgi:hypothetical protein
VRRIESDAFKPGHTTKSMFTKLMLSTVPSSNRSCEPNAERRVHDDGNQIHVRARRAIINNQEIFISFLKNGERIMDEDWQVHLRDWFGTD